MKGFIMKHFPLLISLLIAVTTFAGCNSSGVSSSSNSQFDPMYRQAFNTYRNEKNVLFSKTSEEQNQDTELQLNLLRLIAFRDNANNISLRSIREILHNESKIENGIIIEKLRWTRNDSEPLIHDSFLLVLSDLKSCRLFTSDNSLAQFGMHSSGKESRDNKQIKLSPEKFGIAQNKYLAKIPSDLPSSFLYSASNNAPLFLVTIINNKKSRQFIFRDDFYSNSADKSQLNINQSSQAIDEDENHIFIMQYIREILKTVALK